MRAPVSIREWNGGFVLLLTVKQCNNMMKQETLLADICQQTLGGPSNFQRSGNDMRRSQNIENSAITAGLILALSQINWQQV
jgi:hypothetical protein